MKHVILVWRCKGKNCGQSHLAKYLGEKEKIEEGVIIRLHAKGDAVLIRCPKCGEQHLYGPNELRSLEMPSPPPDGYKEIL